MLLLPSLIQNKPQNTLCNLGPATDTIVLRHPIYSEKNAKRPGGQLPANSHLGNKNRVLMGTVSRGAAEPRAGNAAH